MASDCKCAHARHRREASFDGARVGKKSYTLGFIFAPYLDLGFFAPPIVQLACLEQHEGKCLGLACLY